METLEDSNCHSLSDSFSLYERYIRSFNVVDTFEEIAPPATTDVCPASTSDPDSAANVDLKTISGEVLNKHFNVSGSAFSARHCMSAIDEKSTDYSQKLLSPGNSQEGAYLENCFVCEESTDKSEHTDAPISSEDSSSKHPKPVIITSASAMENSNNAVDSVPMFHGRKPADSEVFKLPSKELTFNGSLKHIQRLKPIVDTSALTSNLIAPLTAEPNYIESNDNSLNNVYSELHNESNHKYSNSSEQTCECNKLEDTTDSTGDSQYAELNPGVEVLAPELVDSKSKAADDESSKWNAEQSYSSLEASFDSGVRSPDMFSDNDEKEVEVEPEPKYFWHFLKDYDAVDKKRVRNMEETLQGVLPPPSVTIVKTDAAEMLKKYYCFLPVFSEDANINIPEVNSTTPTKLTSYVKIPDTKPEVIQETSNLSDNPKIGMEKAFSSISKEVDKNSSVSDNCVVLKMTSEADVKETAWPEVAKCRFYDVHYNLTKFSERLELLALRCGERYVGAETDTSVTVYSGGQHSPSSANKRKALRLKMAQAKSPGRRLSHLARRRQAFCSAATINEKAHASGSKLVLIDKNFFPHRKLINSDRRRTPGKRTPTRKTPGKKTPGKKTPTKTPSQRTGSSKKKAMRRLLMDPETLTRSQPTRETSKRALFISPENRKSQPMPQPTSVPIRVMKSKRALFGSPDRPAETKSLDGYTDMFLKRKREALEETADYGSRSKIAKSLSFGGEGPSGAGAGMSRRASEMSARGGLAELGEHHRKKLLWAVSEALRTHGWRMQSPGFREKASSLARLTRRLLTLAPHKARLAAPTLSSSETMLKIARQYVFAIIQGRSIEECFLEEQARLAGDGAGKVTGYISSATYQQMNQLLKSRAATTSTSQIKENTCDGMMQEQQRSGSKNILQDKLLNIDNSSNSSSGFSMLGKPALYKSNSMPSFEEAAKMRARRQISFDNVDFPKR